MTTTKLKTTKFKEPSSAQQFLEGAGTIDNRTTQADLKKLTVDELADRAESIAKQSTLMLGLICLEARSRFSNNNEFGEWRKNVEGLSHYSAGYISQLLNLTRFSLTHDMRGIGTTVGFEISSPQNADVAEKVYNYIKRKNMKVEEVRRFIAQEKAVLTIPKQSEVAEAYQEHKIEIESHEPTPLKVIPVVKNVAIEDLEPEEEGDTVGNEAINVIIESNDKTDTDEPEDDYQGESMSDQDYANKIDSYAQSLGMSDLVAIRVYSDLIRRLQGRMYRR